MARTRYTVVMYFHDSLATWSQLDKTYHPDYEFNKYSLYWNTGNGYRTDLCLNANGNTSFDTNARNFYIGAGTPTEAAALISGTTASSLVGVSGGIVDPPRGGYTQLSNYWTVTQGSSFTEYDCSAVSNNPAFGLISVANLKGSSVSWKNFTSSSISSPGYGYNYYATGPTAVASSGCKFIGWLYNGKIQSKMAYVAADYSVTAIFASQFTLSFNTNGGTGSMDSQTYYGGAETYAPQGNIPANTFTKSGYVFTGWNTSASGTGTTIANTASVSSVFDALSPAAGGTVTLYAQWRRPTVYIKNTNTSVGSLKLYRNSIASAHLVATESGGYLAADVSAGTYLVVCTSSNPLYVGGGLSDGTTIVAATTDSAGNNVTTVALSSAYNGNFFFNKLTTYNVTFASSPVDGGSATIAKTSGSTDADEDGKWLPQVLRFFITPATGYDCASLHVVDAVDGTSSQPAVANPPVSPAYYQCDLSQMDDDVTVDLIFTKQKFNVGVEVDSASASVGNVTVNEATGGVSDVEYGSSVTFRAALKNGVSADDYAFEGWYLDGARISTDAELSYEITKAVTLVAKFATKVAIGIAFTDNREDTSTAIAPAATLVLNGTTYEIDAATTNSDFVVLGASVSWTVTPGASWFFNAFYAPTDTEYKSALDYERIGTVEAVGEALHIVARLTTVKIQSSAVVKVHVNDPATDIDPDADNPAITASGFETTIADGGYSFTLDGTWQIVFSAKATITVGGVEYAFNCFATDVPTSTGYKVLSREINYKRTLNSPKVTIYALYGAFAEVEMSVAYGTGSDRTMGVISIGGESNAESGAAKVSVVAKQGTTVVAAATAKNGYRFKGWYYNGNVSGEPDETEATLAIFVTSERTILAAFEKARDAIYEWEGSDENKMMEWKSKVYAASRPFNPSALRVDTNGYPVGEVRVGMFSAPDVAETAVSILKNVASQNSRRLPKRRPERYLQVAVKNDNEVDRILVGTSMEGVSA